MAVHSGHNESLKLSLMAARGVKSGTACEPPCSNAWRGDGICYGFFGEMTAHPLSIAFLITSLSAEFSSSSSAARNVLTGYLCFSMGSHL